jgi:predicted ATPase
LARLIGQASQQTQVIVVSHAAPLIDALAELPGCRTLELIKELGETRVRGQLPLDGPHWEWGRR